MTSPPASSRSDAATSTSRPAGSCATPPSSAISSWACRASARSSCARWPRSLDGPAERRPSFATGGSRSRLRARATPAGASAKRAARRGAREPASPCGESRRDHRHRQEEGHQRRHRRRGGPRRSGRTPKRGRARRHGPGRHPQQRPDRRREGQRTRRGLWVAIFIVIALLTLGPGLARGGDRGRGGPRSVWADPGGQSAFWLHDQPRHAVRADPVARPRWSTTRSSTSRTSPATSPSASVPAAPSPSKPSARSARRSSPRRWRSSPAFLPLFFITGMMGPYMSPMALNVPVTMLMSMVVAFTITPWLAYHLLKKRAWAAGGGHGREADPHDDDAITGIASIQYRSSGHCCRRSTSRRNARVSRMVAVLTVGAAMLAAIRQVPLKMLPFDNKTELLVLLDADEGNDAGTHRRGGPRGRSRPSRTVPEVTDFTSYVGLPSPIDFNGLVRHYYLRTHCRNSRRDPRQPRRQEVACDASHTLGLRCATRLTAIAARTVRLKIVELPPGPPVIDTIVAEVYGGDDTRVRATS